MKKATVFGGGWDDRNTPEYAETVEIGKILAEAGYAVKTGGYRGIMEAASKGAFDAGGHTVGYTCTAFGSAKGNAFLKETIPSADLFDRLRHLINDTDIFVVQKGGTGTLAELFLVLDIVRKKKNDRPKILLVSKAWSIIAALDMISEAELDMMELVTSLEEFRTFL
jgi:uncharacterized protein (TIGR00725 family)